MHQFLCNIDSSFSLMFYLVCTLIIRVKKTRWYIHCCLTKTLLQGTKPSGENKTLGEGKSTTYQYHIYSRLPLLSTTPPDSCINQGSSETFVFKCFLHISQLWF